MPAEFQELANGMFSIGPGGWSHNDFDNAARFLDRHRVSYEDNKLPILNSSFDVRFELIVQSEHH